MYQNSRSLFRFVDHVTIGDEVLVQGHDDLSPSKVISVSNVMMQGEYIINPKSYYGFYNS